MGRIFGLIIFIIVVAILWWALSTVLSALGVPEPWRTLSYVAFVLLALWAAVDNYNSGTWFWTRRG